MKFGDQVVLSGSHRRLVGKLSTITLITAAPPMLDNATKTAEIPRIPLESSAQ